MAVNYFSHIAVELIGHHRIGLTSQARDNVRHLCRVSTFLCHLQVACHVGRAWQGRISLAERAGCATCRLWQDMGSLHTGPAKGCSSYGCEIYLTIRFPAETVDTSGLYISAKVRCQALARGSSALPSVHNYEDCDQEVHELVHHAHHE
jgi:hypothetical protein